MILDGRCGCGVLWRLLGYDRAHAGCLMPRQCRRCLVLKPPTAFARLKPVKNRPYTVVFRLCWPCYHRDPAEAKREHSAAARWRHRTKWSRVPRSEAQKARERARDKARRATPAYKEWARARWHRIRDRALARDRRKRLTDPEWRERRNANNRAYRARKQKERAA